MYVRLCLPLGYKRNLNLELQPLKLKPTTSASDLENSMYSTQYRNDNTQYATGYRYSDADALCLCLSLPG